MTEDPFAALLAARADPLAICHVARRWLNATWCLLWGGVPDMLGCGLLAVVGEAPRDLPADEVCEALLEGAAPHDRVFRARHEGRGVALLRWEGGARAVPEARAPVLELALAGLMIDRALRSGSAFTREILENIPVLVFWKNLDGSLAGCNREFSRVLGFRRPADLIGDMAHHAGSDRFRDCDREVAWTGTPMLGIEETVRRPDGRSRSLVTSKFPLTGADGEVVGVLGVSEDVTEFRAAERRSRRLAAAVDQVKESVVITTAEGVIIYVNPAFEAMTGYDAALAAKKNVRVLAKGPGPAQTLARIRAAVDRDAAWRGRLASVTARGITYTEEVAVSPVSDAEGGTAHLVWMSRDVTDELAMEVETRHAQKMESIGRLAAGIAHELNTPNQYVADNTRFVDQAFKTLIAAVNKIEGLIEAPAGDLAELVTGLRAALDEADLEFTRAELPGAIKETLEGTDRMARIVAAMREFSHPGRELKARDLNRAIETTVTVARNEWRYVAEVELRLDPTLPAVPCVLGEINQAILNVVVNAAHAIKEVVAGGDERGRITISTAVVDGMAEIRVSDTGAGIPVEARDHIFEPFFTTKEVGVGTGQGLHIVHGVIVAQHQGTLDFETALGEGTTFILRLPLSELDGGRPPPPPQG